MQNWLEKHHKAGDKLFRIPLHLRELAQAFSIVGNDVVGEKLHEIADIIEKSREEMNQAVGQSINEAIENSQKTTAVMFESVLKKELNQ